jgi:hypothetical protein
LRLGEFCANDEINGTVLDPRIFFYYFVTSFDILPLKTDVNVPLKVISKKTLIKKLFFIGIASPSDKKAGSGSVTLTCGSRGGGGGVRKTVYQDPANFPESGYLFSHTT